MPQNDSTRGRTILILIGFLLSEVAMLVSLRTLGWFGTGSLVHIIVCLFATLFPLLVATALLVRNRLRFGLRTLLVAVTLVAVFMFVSVKPLQDYHSARSASKQLVLANATLDSGLDWDKLHTDIGLEPAPSANAPEAVNVPLWLRPFTDSLSATPPDASVKSIHLNNDQQVEILVENSSRFRSLRSISIAFGVSSEGLKKLQAAIPEFNHLSNMLVNDVTVPKNWYRTLTGIKALFVWGEGASRGTPFPQGDLADIKSLPQLEVLMILGYAFNDSDAKTLSSSLSLKRIILRGTAVTQKGESDLENTTVQDRIVYRN